MSRTDAAAPGLVVGGPSPARPATLARRAGAYLIDTAIALVVLLVGAGVFAGISLATEGAFPVVLAGIGAYVVLVAWLVVYTLLQGRGGSLGMRALGLRLTRADDAAAPLGFGRALARNVVWALGGAILVGYFSPLFDSSPWRRGWHDKASGALMTDVAGHTAVPLEDLSTQAVTDDSGDRAVVASASSPSVLPAAPILPPGEDTDLAGWTPGAPAAARQSDRASGVISFVPGITDPDLYDAPPPAAPPVPPTVEVAGPAPVAPAVPAARAAVDDDGLEQTRLSGANHPVARLVWDDGTRFALYDRTVFGRNPAREPGAMAVPVRDETLSLSKTHFELVPDADRALWVIDRHSTNGVVIRRGTQRHTSAPGERTRVRMGDVLEFGDRSVSIEVAP